MGTKLSDLTATTSLADSDELYVNDGGVGKKATVATLRTFVGVNAAVDNTRLGTGIRLLNLNFSQDSTSATIDTGFYRMGLAWVPTQSPTSISVDVQTAASPTGNIYISLYELDPTDGLPGVEANRWGPFACTTTGLITLTSQTEVVSEGWYWLSAYADNGNSGNVAIRGYAQRYSGVGLFAGTGADYDAGLTKSGATSTPTADHSATTGWDSADSHRLPKVHVA